MNIYLIGSLHNPLIPVAGNLLRQRGHEVFDNWHASGPDADAHWRDYHRARGNSFIEGLDSPEAVTSFALDMAYLDWCDQAVLLLPAGKSGHLELGWAIGRGKVGHIVLKGEPDTWDLMYRLAHVHTSMVACADFLGEAQ